MLGWLSADTVRASRSNRSLNAACEILDGDRAAEAGVASLVDLAHSAGGERRDDLVRSETFAWVQGHAMAGL